MHTTSYGSPSLFETILRWVNMPLAVAGMLSNILVIVAIVGDKRMRRSPMYLILANLVSFAVTMQVTLLLLLGNCRHRYSVECIPQQYHSDFLTVIQFRRACSVNSSVCFARSAHYLALFQRSGLSRKVRTRCKIAAKRFFLFQSKSN